MRYLYTTEKGYDVFEYDYFEWRNREIKEKPKYGIVKAKNKSKDHVRAT